MTATDELRRMLDERGIEYRVYDEPDESIICTCWEACGFLWDADDREERIYLSADRLITPEQAIAATLGTGTCQVDTTENWLPAERYHRCKHCGAFFAVLDASGDIPPRFCPNCGRRIEVEG